MHSKVQGWPGFPKSLNVESWTKGVRPGRSGIRKIVKRRHLFVPNLSVFSLNRSTRSGTDGKRVLQPDLLHIPASLTEFPKSTLPTVSLVTSFTDRLELLQLCHLCHGIPVHICSCLLAGNNEGLLANDVNFDDAIQDMFSVLKVSLLWHIPCTTSCHTTM